MIGWVDASSGASGDMLLGALVGAGVPLEVVAGQVRAVAPEHVALTAEAVTRNGFAATRCHVEVADSVTHRTWRDIAVLLAEADLDDAVRHRAHATFERLATAEAHVHGTSAEDVHFHEVGALDAIADVVGVCAGLEHLGLDALVVSPVAVGSGTVSGSHGSMPVPPPAVAELLRGRPSYSGPVRMELCTPTGAALLTANATSFGPQPAMSVERIGVGAGGRDPEGHANVLRLFVGVSTSVVSTSSTNGTSVEVSTSSTNGTSVEVSTSAASVEPVETRDTHGTDAPTLLEANIDDLDPRLWPNVIAALLDAGASDAWLTPILMKKGRPAHTLSVLVAAPSLDAVRTEVFRQTSTIGVREMPVGKTALERETRTVSVGGVTVRVKLALHNGQVVNAQPEYDDVAHAAAVTGRPIKDVLAEASAASRKLSRD